MKHLILLGLLSMMVACSSDNMAYYKGQQVEVVAKSCKGKVCKSVIKYPSTGLTSEVPSSDLVKP